MADANSPKPSELAFEERADVRVLLQAVDGRDDS
jgi:hypothetical protein